MKNHSNKLKMFAKRQKINTRYSSNNISNFMKKGLTNFKQVYNPLSFKNKRCTKSISSYKISAKIIKRRSKINNLQTKIKSNIKMIDNNKIKGESMSSNN